MKIESKELLKEFKQLIRNEEKELNKIDVTDPETGENFDIEPYEGTFLENIVECSYREGRLSMLDNIMETIKNN